MYRRFEIVRFPLSAPSPSLFVSDGLFVVVMGLLRLWGFWRKAFLFDVVHIISVYIT